MQMRCCIAAVLGIGLASSFATLTSAQPPQRVSAVSFADSPLTVATSHASHTTPERAASVTWDVTNVTSRPISDYSVRVYVYREDGAAVGFGAPSSRSRCHRAGRGAPPSSSRAAWRSRPSDVVLIVITRVAFEDGSEWDAPADVLDRVKAEVTRIGRRGAAAQTPRLQHAAFLPRSPKRAASVVSQPRRNTARPSAERVLIRASTGRLNVSSHSSPRTVRGCAFSLCVASRPLQP
jgi:hypothetical protein